MLTDNTITNNLKNFFNTVGRKKVSYDYIGYLIVAKARKIKNCRLQIVDSVPKFDPLIDPEYGIIKVIFRTSYYEEYKISIGDERDFDTLFIIGINRDEKVIEKVLAIPEKELVAKRFITITRTGQYQKFEIDENPYIQIFDNIKKGKYLISKDNDITIIQNNKEDNSNMTTNVKVYTTVQCTRCPILKQMLKNNGIEYEEIDMRNAKTMAYLFSKDSSIVSAPVLEVCEKLYSNVDTPEKLEDILKSHGIAIKNDVSLINESNN